MRILYLHQYFRTPEEGGALRSYYLSQALVQAGHKVELITAYNGRTYKTADIDGVIVHYLPIPYSNDFGFVKRVSAFLKFVWKSTVLAFKLKNIDCCFATSTPLTIGLSALILKKIKGIPYIFEVRDLWPEAPIQLGFIRNTILKSVLIWFEKELYRNAEKIVALSPGMVSGIEKFKLSTPVYLIPNMADCDFYKPVYKPDSEDFLVVYTGMLGKANKVEFLLQIAKICQEKGLAEIKFIITGSGSEEEFLKQKARGLQLNNLQVSGNLTKNEIRDLLQKVAATYTSFDTFPVLETNSPNKFFDSLAAGKLSIVNTKGWLKELVENSNCGFYADPLQPDTFVQKIIPFLQDPNLLHQYQQNARKLAEAEFDRKKLCQEFVKLF
jgi:glycosyltransferase involved in cell wall biosynthesis